ncbi:hypothetical protein [Pseudomonas syringae group sp. J309-1]|uniref:hypothetical protein n=1 Tax=Pseudomonas syringae group sp. J309-1 TaxID=3079588 RepID=UPI0029138CB4|nr:hypothetical protein [Pseudomonas syringae group sp. J309-1]MDU8360212.1 hypothetical protein [Pseudomonas syringae group sp. J309-1]
MNLYEIIFSGQLVPGAQLDKVQANLGKLFQSDAQRLELLFSGRRLVLKNNLDSEAAEKYRSTLERAGALVEVLEMQTLKSETDAVARPSAQPGRLEVTPRDVYMAAFVGVDAPDLEVCEVGSDLQDQKRATPAPSVDFSQFSLAPTGSELGQIPNTHAGPVPDTSHLKLV